MNISIIIASISLIAFLFSLYLIYIYHYEFKRLQRFLTEAQEGNAQLRFYSRIGLFQSIGKDLNHILQQLHHSHIQQRREEERRQLFLSSVSHDLRTPLTSVLGYIEAVHLSLLDEEKKAEYVQIAYQKGMKLQETLNLFFEWTRLDVEPAPAQNEEKNIAEIVRDVVIEFIPLIEKNQIEIDVEIPDFAVTKVHEECYRRIVQNVLKNIFDHSVHCTKIMVSLTRDSKYWNLAISDNGAVQTPINHEEWFDPFVKRNGSTGTGLGLAVCKKLAQSFNGDITFRTNQDRGLTFQILWPC